MPTVIEELIIPELNTAQIGNRIKKARTQCNFSQEMLAGYCSCSSNHLSNVENGREGISLELLFKISVALNTSMDYFVMDNPKANTQTVINMELAPKLAHCDADTIVFICDTLDRLLAYRDGIETQIKEK